MPWSVSDVDSHKKGLSPSQKKKWVSVANGIYKECMKTGTDAVCAPKAIRIANSKFSEEPMKNKETLKLNRSALIFTDHETFAKVEAKEEGAKRKLSMVAYSGKMIKGHWYWGDLAIDTSGVKFAKKEIPILEDHSTDRKIGFGAFQVNDQHQIVARDMTYLDTPFAQDFVKNSDAGFPYEASIFARPSKIQRLMEQEETEVNGYKMKGPGTVWRESVVKECSVCTFGADSNTKSAAMSEDEEVAMEVEGIQLTEKREVNMDLEKLKAEFPELYAQVFALGKTEAETAFVATKTELESTITALKAENGKLAADNTKVSERLVRLEKQDMIRTEAEIKASADTIFASKMKDASIPVRLQSKIRALLKHEPFVKDDKLDGVAWSAAIETELKDWAPKDGEETAIMGMNFTAPKEGTDAEADASVARMLGYVGQSATKQ
jgi:hypothetical protein